MKGAQTYLAPRLKIKPCKSDLEKVVNRPQAENSELYNALKIA